MKIYIDESPTGLIDRDEFALSYARKIMRDHIDGRRSEFLRSSFSVHTRRNCMILTHACALYVAADDRSGITVGLYLPRKDRYEVLCTPQEIAAFFDLQFDDYIALHSITDNESKCLARLRW